jgi:signal transduction histidine kinase/CheY-like chemotaxis protein
MELLEIKQNVLSSITKCLSQLSISKDIRTICSKILTELVNITGDKMAFVAELKYNDKGIPFFRYRAVIGDTIINKYHSYYMNQFVKNDNLDFYNMDTLHGLVYTTGETIISNDVINDKRRGGTVKYPSNHPVIDRFIGIPIKKDSELIGMIGLANNTIEYTTEYADMLKPYVDILSFIIAEWNVRESINLSKNRFLLHMSHEIKTPLNGIIGMTQHILDTKLTDEQLEIIECLSQCNFRLLTLVNDIGDFYKISMGHIDIEEKPIKISHVIEESYELYRSDIELKNIKFTYNIIDKSVNDIVFDKKRLMQILLNLISNSTKFTHSGEISIVVNSVDDMSDKIPKNNIFHKNEQTYNNTNNKKIIHFTVKDTGIGISPDKINLIFNEFQNLDSGLLADSESGRGLGLAICKLLANAFEGNIWIESKLGIGTSVHFTIKANLLSEVDNIKNYLIEKFKDTYILILVDQDKDRLTISNTFVEFGIVPIIVNNETEAKIYFQKMKITFSIVIISQIFINPDIINLIKNTNKYIIIIGISSTHISDNISFYIDPSYTSTKLLKFIYDHVKNTASALFDNVQKPQEILSYQSRQIELQKKDSSRQTLKNELPVNPNSITDKYSYIRDSLPLDYTIGNETIRILIAEDEIANQKVLTTILKKIGFVHIDLAVNGQIMVDKAISNTYNIIFIDIRMPIKDGYTATSEIVEFYKKHNRYIPFLIAVTALEDLDIMHKCTQIGINYVLKKPFSFNDVIEIMKIVKNKKYYTTV